MLVTGATGYVGGRLLGELAGRRVRLRCLARRPAALVGRVGPGVEVVGGDVRDWCSLERALRGVEAAYYLVHRMAGSRDYAQEDREAAECFGAVAREAGVRRIVYLGGLGDESDPRLSAHLRSRHEVGRILRGSGVETIEFRASMVIGAGSLSFELLRALTERLPVMVCPRWLATPTQPIAVADVVAYLVAALALPAGPSRVFEVGTPEVTTYRDLIREYARQRGLRRWLVTVPVLTPRLSAAWLAVVTPARYEVGRHLIEGLRNPMVVRDPAAREVFSIRPMGVAEAIGRALAELGGGAGVAAADGVGGR